MSTKKPIIILAIAIIFLLSINSCKKDEVINNNTPYTPKSYHLDIVWQRYFYNDSIYSLLNDPIISGDNVVFCSYLLSSPNHYLGSRVFNKFTGVAHPAWINNPGIMLTTNSHSLHFNTIGGNNNIIVMTDRMKLFAMEMNSGNLLWTKTFLPENCLTVNTSWNGNIIQTFGTWDSDIHQWNVIGEFDYLTGDMKTLFNLDTYDGFDYIITTPTFYIDKNHDTIMYFKTCGWNYSLVKGKEDLFAYNLSKDTMLWQHPDFVLNSNASSYYPMIKSGNKLVISSQSSIHCVNAIDGSIIWEKNFPKAEESFNQTKIIVEDGKVFVRSGSGKIRAFDLENGNIIWTNPYGGQSEYENMDYYGGKLYFAATFHDVDFSNYYSALVCVYSNTGGVQWLIPGPCQGVVIDKSTGFLYTSVGGFISCINLKTTPKYY